MTRAILYDGVTADRRQVGIEAGDGRLIVIAGDAREVFVPSDLTLIEEDAITVTLGRRDQPGWRLHLPQPVEGDVRALLPGHSCYGAWIDRVGLLRATGLLAGVAAAVLFVGYSAPAWLAPYVPESWERNLGTAIVGDFGENACRDPRAAQALARMADRVEPARGRRAPITLTLIDVGIFNAAALPGGQIVIFDGALRETPNPDAMAGVLAHEIAHVRRRHVTQALIRELGIGALIRLFAGDIGANAQQLVSLNYTRANEAEADRDAITALAAAGIDPRPTAALFRKLARDDGAGVTAEFLESHPRSAGRARRFAESWRRDGRYTPSLSAAEYRAMRTACPVPKNAGRTAQE